MSKFYKRTKLLPLLLPQHWPFWLAAGILRLLVTLPYRNQLQLGRSIGWLCFHIAKKSRHTTLVNLELCFPKLSPEQRIQLAKASFASTGISFLEIAMAWWCGNKRLQRLKHRVTGYEEYTKAQRLNKGVILLGTHMSSFAIAGRILATEFDFAVVYRRQKIPVLDYLAVRAYHKHFHRAIVREDMRQMITTLKAKIPLWITPDIDPQHKASIFVPFFGVPAATVVVPAKFAALTDSTILPVSHYRRDDGKGYDLCSLPLMLDIPSGDVEQDTIKINQMIETIIRKAPAQYLWQYKRFKTRPAGEQNPYHR